MRRQTSDSSLSQRPTERYVVSVCMSLDFHLYFKVLAVTSKLVCTSSAIMSDNPVFLLEPVWRFANSLFYIDVLHNVSKIDVLHNVSK